jgi:hypothetical protein
LLVNTQNGGAYTFRRYEAEGAHYVPLWTPKWILGLHAWGVFSDASSGATVPFYLMPAIGGKNTLRGFRSYRFHDNDMAIANNESRWALLTHMDVALFGDVGRVAHTVSDLDFHDTRKSYGAGIRFHNATATLLRIDAGHSAEGWRVYLVLTDSFKRTTPASGRMSAPLPLAQRSSPVAVRSRRWRATPRGMSMSRHTATRQIFRCAAARMCAPVPSTFSR